MPVIRIQAERLQDLIGLGLEEIREKLFMLKCETDLLDDGNLEIEVNPDRPDMLIGEGVSRAVKGIARIETGYTRIDLGKPALKLYVSPPPTRPFIAAAIVRGVNVDEDYLVELIQFQEKLHATFGRRRRKAAIGFHDASKLPSTILHYRADNIEEVVFQPLGGAEPITASRVLSETEQGHVYGKISIDGNRHPMLYSGEYVIAMPPVINAEITRVEPGTRDLFIDVTGTDRETVTGILDVIVSNLAERPGAIVEPVEIVYKNSGTMLTPVLREDEIILETSYVNRVLGISLATRDVAEALDAMRFSVSTMEGSVRVTVPPYRLDILAPIDLVEDVAISMGYEWLGVKTGWPILRGRLLDETRLSRRLALMMVGLGFIEIAQLTLTGPSSLSGLEGLSDDIVEVENPVALEYSLLRPSLLVTMLQVAQANIGAQKPVKVFEIGYVVYPSDEKVVEDQRLGYFVMDYKAGYEDVQAPLYALLERLGAEPEAEEEAVPGLIPGRTARVKANGVPIGVIGEVSPEILVSRGIEYPVAIGEISLSKLLEALGSEGQ